MRNTDIRLLTATMLTALVLTGCAASSGSDQTEVIPDASAASAEASSEEKDEASAEAAAEETNGETPAAETVEKTDEETKETATEESGAGQETEKSEPSENASEAVTE